MPPIPGENFVLQLIEAADQPNLVHMNVLDIAVAGVADTVALVEWAYSFGAAPVVSLAGFSVMRFDLHGNLMWQLSRQLCTFPNFECGKWEIEGHLARASNGFIVAGSGINFDDSTRRPLMFALRIDDFGAILWSRTYVPPTPIPDFGRLVSIAPMEVKDHFLLGATTFEKDSWFFEIDGAGKVVNSVTLPSFHLSRLRATPTQGICAVGAMSHVDSTGTLHTAVLNFDPTKLSARWLRAYTFGNTAPLPGVRWLDIAEGENSLLVVGNHKAQFDDLLPMMAFIETDAAGPKVGDVRSAFNPVMADHPVRLRGVASFVEEIVPIAAGGGRKARFAVCGEVQQQPWQFLIGEDGVVEWQKRYRLPDGRTGSLAPIRWPAFHHILAGGAFARGSRSNGFLASSAAVLRPGDQDCSIGISVDLVDHVLYQRHLSPIFDTLSLEARDCFFDAGPALRVKKACLDSQ